jgi:hypothetical protein
MIRFAARLVLLLVALVASTSANAAFRYNWDTVLLPQDAALPTLSPQPEQRFFDQMFRAQGIDPDSNKARIVRAWIDRTGKTRLLHRPSRAARKASAGCFSIRRCAKSS